MAKFNSSTIAFATIIAFGAIGQAAQASETYVTNRDITSFSRTTTDLNMNSDSWSRGSRDWSSYAYKEYYDGSASVDTSIQNTVDGDLDISFDEFYSLSENCNCGGYTTTEKYGSEFVFEANDLKTTHVASLDTKYNDFTYHEAGVYENGSETFGSNTEVKGTIVTRSGSDTVEHETASGTR